MWVIKPMPKKKFWTFKAQTETTPAELLLYGPISSESWWGDEVTPKQFDTDLKALGNISELTVRINSDGGDVFAGQAIYSILKRHHARVTVLVDGLAASIASVIAMAGDKVIMPRNAMIMVHNPWTIAVGTADDFRSLADDMDKIRESLIVVYQDKSGMGKDQIIHLMNAETWLTAEDAVNYGFADEIEETRQLAASIDGQFLIMNGQKFDMGRYRNPPKLSVSTKGVPYFLNEGRTLSAANEERISQARDLLSEVLDQLTKEGQDNKDPNKTGTKKEEQTENGLLSIFQAQLQINQNRRF